MYGRVNLGYKEDIVLKQKNEKQPVSIHYNDNTYIIVYNGQIYNSNTITKELQNHGFRFSEHDNIEVLLKAFIYFGNDVVTKLNGIFSFAIWDENKQELFLARDHFGVKPLYYTLNNGTFIFASEIKSILKFPEIKAKVDATGISELFGIGPAHTPGISVFKDIYEIKPAHFGIFNKNGFKTHKYWSLENKPHTDTFKQTCDKIYYLLEDSIKRQTVSDSPVSLLLSRWFGF